MAATSVFARSVRVFRDNPIVAAPMLVVGLLTLGETNAPHFFHISIATARAVVDPTVDKLVVCIIVALANAAWRYGRARWSDAWRSLRKHALDLTALMWLWLMPVYGMQFAMWYSGPGHAVVQPLIGVASFLLWPVIWLCSSWSATAVVTGNLRILPALRMSLSLTRRCFGKTLWLFLIWFVPSILFGAFVTVPTQQENLLNVRTVILEVVLMVITFTWAAVVRIMYIGEYLLAVPDAGAAVEQSRPKEDHIPLTTAAEPAS